MFGMVGTRCAHTAVVRLSVQVRAELSVNHQSTVDVCTVVSPIAFAFGSVDYRIDVVMTASVVPRVRSMAQISFDGGDGEIIFLVVCCRTSCEAAATSRRRVQEIIFVVVCCRTSCEAAATSRRRVQFVRHTKWCSQSATTLGNPGLP